MASTLVALIAAGAMACGAGQSARPAAEVVPAPGPPKRIDLGASTFIVAGESMRFSISLRGVPGGETVTAFGQPGTVDGRQTIIAASRTQTTGLAAVFKEVRDEVTTHIDLANGLPFKQSANVKFGEKEAKIATEFGLGPFFIHYHRRGQGPRVYKQMMPPGQGAYDAHAALAALRAWHPPVGQRAYFHALAGKRIWRAEVTAGATEELKTRLGTFQAFRIEGTAWRLTRHLTVDKRKQPRKFTLFIAQDGDRKPLLVEAQTEYGTVRMELVQYQRPPFRLSSTR